MSFRTEDHRSDWDRYLSELFMNDFSSNWVEYKNLTKKEGHKEFIESIG